MILLGIRRSTRPAIPIHPRRRKVQTEQPQPWPSSRNRPAPCPVANDHDGQIPSRRP
ncbi:hypothetical protein BDW75DRAFT_213370 [Aspergillus navahoensis]